MAFHLGDDTCIIELIFWFIRGESMFNSRRKEQTIETRDYFSFLVLFIILLAVGTFFDREIAGFVTIEGNMFSKAVDAYAMMPMSVAFSVFGTMIISVRNYQNRTLSMFQMIFGLILIGCGMGLGFYYPYHFLPEIDYRIHIGVSVVLNIIVDYVLYHGTVNAHKDEVQKYLKVVAVSVIVPMLICYGVRFVLGRTPYVLLDETHTYVRWYESVLHIGSIYHTSLPATPVVSVVPLTTFALYGNVNRAFRFENRVFLFIAYILILVVCGGALISGQYYLSDIALSVIFTYIIEGIAMKTVYGE